MGDGDGCEVGCAILEGTWNWQRYLKKADEFSKGNYEGKMEAVAQLFGATNYKDREPPWNPFIYSFDLFDIEECRAEVRAALDSKTSLAYAMKKYIMPFGEEERSRETSMRGVEEKA